MQVAPLLVAEIVVDQTYDRVRYRHPYATCASADLEPDDVERWRSG